MAAVDRIRGTKLTHPNIACVPADCLVGPIERLLPNCASFGILSVTSEMRRRAGNGPDFVEHHCTCSVVLVERTSEPLAADDVPVTVMVYAPAGVPELPVMLLLPPHAT